MWCFGLLSLIIFININDKFYIIEAAVFVIHFSEKVLYNVLGHCNGVILIFISGRGSIFSSVQGGKSGSFYLVKSY